MLRKGDIVFTKWWRLDTLLFVHGAAKMKGPGPWLVTWADGFFGFNIAGYGFLYEDEKMFRKVGSVLGDEKYC